MKRDKKAMFESIMATVSKQVKRALNESAMDGWDENELDFLTEVLSQIYDLKYEIESCRRGAFTNCETYEELSNHVRELADGLSEAADILSGMEGPLDEPDESDDSWEGPYETDEERAQREEDERDDTSY